MNRNEREGYCTTAAFTIIAQCCERSRVKNCSQALPTDKTRCYEVSRGSTASYTPDRES